MKTIKFKTLKAKPLLIYCFAIFSLFIGSNFALAVQSGGRELDSIATLPANAAAKILPAHSHAYGKTLSEWLTAYWRVALTSDTPITTPVKFGRMTFMPIPTPTKIGGSGTPEDPDYYKGQIEVTLKPGTPFVLPAIALYYEKYSDGSEDSVFPNEYVQSTITDQRLTLDDKPILEDFWDYFVSQPFDPAAVYPEPTSYGSVAAIHLQSVGFVAAPLTPGTHKVTVYEKWLLPGLWNLIYDNTWIIHVGTPKK